MSLPTRSPRRTLETALFWDACVDGRLVLPQCEECGQLIWYPRRFCPFCASRSVRWVEVSGRGTVYSFTVIRRGEGPFRAAAPYVLAYVELEEGPRMLTNIVDADVERVAIGDPVHVVFEPTDEGDALPRFVPD
jgi:uncharacterized protein